jgi:hypothetical protein
MIVNKPPKPLNECSFENSIFLAGSIEMGKAIDWQKRVEEELKDIEGNIFNPRRDDWDSSWKQDINNDQFRNQVEWEIQALENSDYILMYYLPNTMSPISLLEMGLHARSEKMIVCCPDGYERKGNVDIVCNWYQIPIVDNFDNLVKVIKLFMNNKK